MLQKYANSQFIDVKEIRHYVDNLGHSSKITNTSETSKTKDLIISESRNQCPRCSGTFIYLLLVMTEI